MNPKEKHRLLYRRQFYLSPTPISDFEHWNKWQLPTGYILYAHPDLLVSQATMSDKQIILIGDIFDSSDAEKGNAEIVNLLVTAGSMDELTEMVYPMGGRYAIIFIQNSRTCLFNDPSASRKIFYTTHLPNNVCGSQPHVIADYCHIQKSVQPDVAAYYNSEHFVKGWLINIADNTAWENIRQLLPNHYLELETGSKIRFWPRHRIKRMSLRQATVQASEVITGIMEGFAKRYPLMMAITSGNDSRVLLAASRKISDEIYLYINKNPGMPDTHRDITISRSLLNKMGLEQHIHEYSQEVDPEFKEIFMKNSAYPIEENMGLIYNIYFKKFQNRVNCPGGFSDIARNFYFTYKKNITADVLAKMYMMSIQNYQFQMPYIAKCLQVWLDETQEVARKYGYNILDLFNWEERNGNWYTTFQEDKDIAQEEFIAFNCRKYMETCLSTRSRYRDLDTNILYKSMVRYMWPAALSELMYPKSWIKFYLKKTRLYVLVRRLMKEY
jgi:hypothetical protein